MDRLQAGDPGQIGPFRLLGRLGEGGMGRVFLGESPGGRKVAIKVVHPQHASDPDFRRRFAREVDTARQVGGFHTAAVVGADPDADPPWMATAYIPGPSLAEAIAAGGPLDEAGVRQLGAALAEGLAAIHQCGLIHRDLKPGNVIMADDGPRIIDFGIAKGADATALTESSAVIGTLRYMSPEQLNGHELTPHSDIFALGTVLAYAATGHDPFQAPTIPAVITRILTGPPDLDPLTGELRGIIADCLAKDPGARPGTGDLLARFSRPAPRDPAVAAGPSPVPAVVPSPVPSPVPAVVPSPEPRPAEAGGTARAAQEPPVASTVGARPVLPLGSWPWGGGTQPPAATPGRAGRASGPVAKTGRGPAAVAAVAALLCVLSPVPLQMLEHRWYGWGDISIGWYLPLCLLILFVAAVLTLIGRSRPLGVGLIFGAALAVVPDCDGFTSWWSGFGGYAVVGITVSALIAAISSLVYFARQIRPENLRAPLAVAYGVVAMGLVVTLIPGGLQTNYGSGSWSTDLGISGIGLDFQFTLLWSTETFVALLALVVPAVLSWQLPAGSGVRAGAIIGWLAGIAALLVGESVTATQPDTRPAPAFWASWAAWVIALAVGIALLARDRRRRPA